MQKWRKNFALLAAAYPLIATGIGIEDIVDGGNDYAWERVELPGTMCGNGSQYKFWVYDSPTSNNQRFVGRIDDGIHTQACDVSFYNLDHPEQPAVNYQFLNSCWL